MMLSYRYLHQNLPQTLTYGLFVLFGFFSYYLKYFSFSSVVQKIPQEQFPIVFALMGVISFISVKYSVSLFSKLKDRSVYLVALVFLLLSYPTYFLDLSQQLSFAYLFFIGSLFGISLLQTYFVASFLGQDKIDEPYYATKLLLAEEVGVFLSAYINLKYGFGLYSLPLVVLTIALLLSSPRPKFIHKTEKIEMSAKYPFGETLIFLFIFFMLCKVFYSYLFIASLKVVEESGSDFLSIFAQFSAFEAVATILILSLRSAGYFNVNWPWAFKTFFVLTFLLMAGISFTENFHFALVACGLAKVWQKVVLKDSTHNIFNSLPKKVRLFYWVESEKSSHLLSYLMLVLLSSAITFLGLQELTIAFSIMLFAAIGFYVLRRLILTITQFHVANIARSDPRAAYVSCLALLVLNAEEHKIALISMVKKTEDVRLKKAVIYVLGKVRGEDSLKALMEIYSKSYKNEVLQLAIVTSMVKFSSHSVDLFLLEALEEIINSQTSLGEIRRSLFLRISERLKDVAIPLLLRILRDSQDYRVIANALIVLGEIGLRRQDKWVFAHLSQYLEGNHSRRTRSNTILYLYQIPAFRKKAYSIFEELLTSSEDNDKAAAAFIAGELELHGITPFIWENSMAVNHHNSTLLFSLLKLHFPEIEEKIIDYILSSGELESILALNQLSSINKNYTRYKVYKALLKRPFDQVRQFVELMQKTGRDFDEDLRLLEDKIEKLIA
jgi:HEAT repeat protein